MPLTAPQPLPPHSPRLARYRVEAEVLAPHPTRADAYLVREMGRFASIVDARLWAASRPGFRVALTSYAAANGWQPTGIGHRTPDGRWFRRNPSCQAVEPWPAEAPR